MSVDLGRTVSAFAPATVANVAVGFDLLGFPIEGPGDQVSLTASSVTGIRIKATGDVPLDASKNTATVGILEMISEFKLGCGVDVSIEKGIPLGSGMGGSAASAVAGVFAANELFGLNLPSSELLRYALLGESLASGASHPDNAAPCLMGGLVFSKSIEPARFIQIPVPGKIRVVLVHPHQRLDTRESRGVLRREVSLIDHIRQSANLGGFISGCYTGDLELIGESLKDVLIEPQRAALIPGFSSVKRAALEAGALGCSISGSGPSVFAWSSSEGVAEKIKRAMVTAFQAVGLASDSWISPVSPRGARIIK